MVNRLRAFYTPRKHRKRTAETFVKSKRYKFVSFKYLAGGVVDKQLTAVQDYLVIRSRAATARQCVYMAAKSMSVDSVRDILTAHSPEPNPHEWLRVEAVPDEVELIDALGKVKALIATAQGIEPDSVTNKLAYEVSIGYVAARIEKYAAEDSTK